MSALTTSQASSGVRYISTKRRNSGISRNGLQGRGRKSICHFGITTIIPLCKRQARLRAYLMNRKLEQEGLLFEFEIRLRASWMLAIIDPSASYMVFRTHNSQV